MLRIILHASHHSEESPERILALACGSNTAAGNRPLAHAVIVARRRAGSRNKIAVTKRQVTASEQWLAWAVVRSVGWLRRAGTFALDSPGRGRVRGAGCSEGPARSRWTRLVVVESVWLAG